MAELTTIWNSYDMMQDMSEVWTPSEENGLKILQENSVPGQYPKHVIIENRIGYMIMPGIYYFGECEEEYLPYWSDNFSCAVKSAVIVRYISTGRGSFVKGMILYLAVGGENIEILKKIHSTLEGTEMLEYEAEQYNGDIFCGFSNDDKSPSSAAHRTTEKTISPVEEDAQELMPGIGICDISVGLKSVFLSRIPVKKYKYAYRSGDVLVLVERKKYDHMLFHKTRKEYDLRLLEELVIRRTEILRCGLSIDRDYHIIDCKEEKEKQVLTQEAYELFRNC